MIVLLSVAGFGFLSFEDEMSVERVTQEHFINLNGKQVRLNKKVRLYNFTHYFLGFPG